jgi:hypothetical protein
MPGSMECNQHKEKKKTYERENILFAHICPHDTRRVLKEKGGKKNEKYLG